MGTQVLRRFACPTGVIVQVRLRTGTAGELELPDARVLVLEDEEQQLHLRVRDGAGRMLLSLPPDQVLSWRDR